MSPLACLRAFLVAVLMDSLTSTSSLITDGSAAGGDTTSQGLLESPQRSLTRDKRDVTDPDTVCNQAVNEWTCVCSTGSSTSSCDGGDHPCCTTFEQHKDQRVVLTFNATVNNVSSSNANNMTWEERVRTAVVHALDDFCDSYPENCTASFGSGERVTGEDVVVTEISHQQQDGDAQHHQLAVTLLVLVPSSDRTRSMSEVIPGTAVRDALLIQNATLEQRVGLQVITITTTSDPDEGLPVRAIIAGSFLGFFLVISCLVSAIKAVRDRRLIKQRNAYKRDQRTKRHRELQESFKKTPERVPKPTSAPRHADLENGDVVQTTSANGCVTMTPHTIEVVVHSDYESQNTQNGHSSPLKEMTNGPGRTTHTTDPDQDRGNCKQSSPPSYDKVVSSQSNLANGHVPENGSPSRRINSQSASLSDTKRAASNQSLNDASGEIGGPSGRVQEVRPDSKDLGDSELATTVSQSDLADDTSVVDNAEGPSPGDTVVTPGSDTDHRPGVINKAYAQE